MIQHFNHGEKWLKRKGELFHENRLLYHHEKILGHVVEQLCLPSSRIPPVLKLGHGAHFSGQYACKATL